jgi:hypothetical protein
MLFNAVERYYSGVQASLVCLKREVHCHSEEPGNGTKVSHFLKSERDLIAKRKSPLDVPQREAIFGSIWELIQRFVTNPDSRRLEPNVSD